MTAVPNKHFLVASDFDQTLSFNVSGQVLSELIGASRFEEKVEGLAGINLSSRAASSPISSAMIPSSAACAASISRRRDVASACARTFPS